LFLYNIVGYNGKVDVGLWAQFPGDCLELALA
jgi:hypothetical protein